MSEILNYGHEDGLDTPFFTIERLTYQKTLEWLREALRDGFSFAQADMNDIIIEGTCKFAAFGLLAPSSLTDPQSGTQYKVRWKKKPILDARPMVPPAATYIWSKFVSAYAWEPFNFLVKVNIANLSCIDKEYVSFPLRPHDHGHGAFEPSVRHDVVRASKRVSAPSPLCSYLQNYWVLTIIKEGCTKQSPHRGWILQSHRESRIEEAATASSVPQCISYRAWISHPLK